MRTNSSNGWAWHRIQQATLERNRRDNDGQCQCQFDGCGGVATTVNHIVERANGGTDDPTNLEAICNACHDRLTAQANQARARQRATAKREAKRKNHPGRRDRHDS